MNRWEFFGYPVLLTSPTFNLKFYQISHLVQELTFRGLELSFLHFYAFFFLLNTLAILIPGGLISFRKIWQCQVVNKSFTPLLLPLLLRLTITLLFYAGKFSNLVLHFKTGSSSLVTKPIHCWLHLVSFCSPDFWRSTASVKPQTNGHHVYIT